MAQLHAPDTQQHQRRPTLHRGGRREAKHLPLAQQRLGHTEQHQSPTRTERHGGRADLDPHPRHQPPQRRACGQFQQQPVPAGCHRHDHTLRPRMRQPSRHNHRHTDRIRRTGAGNSQFETWARIRPHHRNNQVPTQRRGNIRPHQRACPHTIYRRADTAPGGANHRGADHPTRSDLQRHNHTDTS